jgi:hypothetical protein
MKKAQEIIQRIISLFLASALPIITGSAVIGGIPIWKAATLAGFSAVAQVIEKLARASIDGDLTAEEIKEAFNGNAKSIKKK